MLITSFVWCFRPKPAMAHASPRSFLKKNKSPFSSSFCQRNGWGWVGKNHGIFDKLYRPYSCSWPFTITNSLKFPVIHFKSLRGRLFKYAKLFNLWAWSRFQIGSPAKSCNSRSRPENTRKFNVCSFKIANQEIDFFNLAKRKK